MIVQYLKMITRDLIKRKSFSLINITGIAIGFTVCMVAVLYVYTELCFDKYIPGVENKYRITWGPSNDVEAILPYVFKEKLEPVLPEGAQMCLRTWVGSQYLSYNRQNFKFEHTLFSDSQFLSMFGTSLIVGDTVNVLNAPFQVLLSEHAAHKMFGERDPLHQSIRMWSNDFSVTGVFRDFPETSHLDADVVIAIPSWEKLESNNLTSWGNKAYDYYVSLPPNTNLPELQKKIKKVYLDSDPWFRNKSAEEKAATGFELEPVTDIHLKSAHVLWDDDKNKGNKAMVLAFVIIGILILLMAAFNYINLSTAYFQTKSTFSGIQKALGANIKNLLRYIFIQTSITVACGFLLSILLVRLFLPYFNMLAARKIPFSLLLIPDVAWIILLMLSAMIVLSAIYPAIIFSRGSPVFALKGQRGHSKNGFSFSLRKLLVISQFIISIALVSGLLVMVRQIRMMTSQKLGFDTEQLIDVNFGLDKRKYELFRTQLEAIPDIAGISATSDTPAGYIDNENAFRLSSETEDKNRSGCSVVEITPDYFDVMHIRLLDGRPFSPAMESENVVVLSKTALKSLGLPDGKILGEKVHLEMGGRDCLIVGVVDDVQYRSLRETPKSVVYVPIRNYYNNVVVRLGKSNHVETLVAIKKAWSSVSSDSPFDFSFFDSKLQRNYIYEISTMHLFNILVIISLAISSLGIFGLIMEITVQRTKEIGIRRVNGARISEVMVMLNRDFVKWVLIAFVIAMPIAYYAMNKWLENFAYKTTLNWWIFALAGVLALVIALLTVSWQSWKAATRNPVEALRYE